MHRTILRAIGFALIGLLMLGASGLVATATEATPEAPPAVVRTVIQEGMPSAAPGQVLQLVRYDIPAKISLPVHIHPGMQVAMVQSGTLHYTVVEGEMNYTRANGEAGVLKAGESTDFMPGDSLVEPQGMIHFGENLTDEPVVLIVASLFEAGAPPSSLVEATPAA
ncbi:MAG TPA: cupin domain-containing protein [Thermomicrobiales bacterium]|nr:cupin domain-containing protein [Thermomicrobiales bacterium]